MLVSSDALHVRAMVHCSRTIFVAVHWQYRCCSHPRILNTPAIAYPPVAVFRFDEATFELGLTSFEAGPEEPVRIYDAARTVVDLMRFRKRLGEPIAHAALHRYLTTPGARPALLLDYAEALGTFGPMRAALDIASAR